MAVKTQGGLSGPVLYSYCLWNSGPNGIKASINNLNRQHAPYALSVTKDKLRI